MIANLRVTRDEWVEKTELASQLMQFSEAVIGVEKAIAGLPAIDALTVLSEVNAYLLQDILDNTHFTITSDCDTGATELTEPIVPDLPTQAQP